MGSFVLAVAATFALTMNIVFIEDFSSARLGMALFVLTVVHLLRYPTLVFKREFAAYALFTAYMFIQLIWTRDIQLAMNTLIPAITFILILVLFGSLVTYHNFRAVLAGILAGILAGAAVYTLAVGFPFVRPFVFSYNAIAGMYLFGLFISLLLACHNQAKRFSRFVGLLFLLLIVATTSIKTNLGILLGVAAAGLVYFRQFSGVLRKNAITLVALGGLLAYFVVSSDALIQTVQSGYDRVMLGIEILEARENLPGYSGVANRSDWMRDGLAGWARNPIFGHGVEAFRSRYVITSHSTVVDLLYNTGLIGFSLFYYMFLSMLWRLATVRNGNTGNIEILIFGMSICYLFITLSGVMHYNSFLAVFVAIGSVVLSPRRGRRHEKLQAVPAT